MTALELENVGKSFGAVEVLKAIDLTVEVCRFYRAFRMWKIDVIAGYCRFGRGVRRYGQDRGRCC